MAKAFSLTTPPPLTKLPTKTFPKCPSLLSPFFPQCSRNTPLTVTFSSRNAPPSKTPAPKPSLFSEGRDEDESRLVCPGCGIFMQDSNPNLPGFYQKPLSSPPKPPEDSDKFLFYELDVEEEEEIDGSQSKSDLGPEFDGLLDRGEEEFDDEDEKLKIEFGEFAPAGAGLDNIVEEIPKKLIDEFDEEEEDQSDRYSSLTKYTLKNLKGEKISEAEKRKKAREAKREEGLKMIGPDLDDHDPLLWDSDDEFVEKEEEEIDGLQSKSDIDSEFGRFSDWDEEEFDDEDEKSKKELDGFAPAGVGYGNITEETLKKLKKEKISKAEKKKKAREAKKKEEEENAVIVCARCHSLRNYGQVKNPNAENLIPDFDFDRLISTRLMRPTTSAPLVIMVVDCVDFDGSFPKRAAKSLFKALEGNKKNPKITKLPKLVLVATKVDLLPSQISPTRLDRWVRNRAKAAGAPKLSGVYLVSARKDLGVRNLLSFIKDLAGPRGNVWVIGAQNAGKSTLINTFAKKDGVKATRLTEAPIPGTTLGILRIPGILPAKAKMYDTPGLLHPYLMSMRLNREEQKMVEIRKELQPRTYRMKAGQTVHVGGLMRLDLTHSSVDTIYISIWASPNVSLHMGKTENADEIREKHVGIRLQPPISQDRVSELGEWKPKEIKVSGVSWDVNSMDIAVSGLGWFSLGMKGEATVTLWTFDGVEVTQREPLVLDRAPFLERPGFLLPKAISDFIGNKSKIEAKAKKKMEEEKNLTGVALS